MFLKAKIMNYSHSIIFGLIALTILSACKSDDEPSSGKSSANKQTNEWIDAIMRNHYLWYEELPEKGELNYENEPENFFQSLLSDKDGKFFETGRQYFSTIHKGGGTKALPPTDGSNTYGIDYMAYLFDTNVYYLRVNYVLPDSPAAEAGITRGDWIVRQNDGILREPYPLQSGGTTRVTLARIDEEGKLAVTRTVQLAAARQVENSPFLLDTVYSLYRNKIAYLIYTHFSSGPNDDYQDKTYDNRMKKIIAGFKAQGVTDCILDLRYNGGGLVNSAQLLTSLLAPATALNDVFCIEKYNDLQNPQTSSVKMNNSADVVSANLNLHRLYVIVSERSASASELVINTLRPYMGETNVILIGTRTLGKNVGAYSFHQKDSYGYTITPITFYIFNKDYKADYADGFEPDILCDEYENLSYDFRPLGDIEESLLNLAIGRIGGSSSYRFRAAGNKTIRTGIPVGWAAPNTPFSGGVLLHSEK